VIFQNNDLLLGVVGEFNCNLKELEKITGTNIYSRGNSILIKSEQKKNELVKNAIKFLADQFIINGSIEKEDIISSVNKFMINEKIKNSEKNIEYIIKTPKKSVIPHSEKQKKYVRALKENEIIISAGPAGTGKTFLAVAVALTMLLEKKIERIILSRPAVEAGERLGFLPGDMKAKINPYMQPLWDNLKFIKNQFKEQDKEYKQIDEMVNSEKLLVTPLAYIRGRSLSNVIFIVDEAQNLTPHEVKTIITRAGENAKFIFTGDVNQIDTPYLDEQSNGLSYLIDKIKGNKLFAHVLLEKGERSELANLANELL